MNSSLKPQNINKRSWYYEEKTHLLLVHEWRTPGGDWIRTDQIKIPWKKIEASLKRVRAPKTILTRGTTHDPATSPYLRTLIDRRTDDERKALKELVRRMREDRNGDHDV